MKNWKLKNIGNSMDGGSATLICLNELGKEIVVEIVQNVSIQYTEELSKIPGRVYINNKLIVKRSKNEFELLICLENMVISKFEKSVEEILKKKIAFIRSQRYMDLVPEKLALPAKRKEYLKSINKIPTPPSSSDPNKT